ncbi:hypothetical protein BX661DRAFT_176831 [Kickxella alabastrina]|uniref:uncharacterized protein n=1 Tax=Kickxella alabastrina TaxID=61397 RepID=UPI0022203E4B|nr:uncharacterized protein BX661DRAFT_176831 [Kickxella alabastrina]KAI7834224.1 hypothetical protein BX661DRAFT_176831 [Kickxella alabastrina]
MRVRLWCVVATNASGLLGGLVHSRGTGHVLGSWMSSLIATGKQSQTREQLAAGCSKTLGIAADRGSTHEGLSERHYDQRVRGSCPRNHGLLYLAFN